MYPVTGKSAKIQSITVSSRPSLVVLYTSLQEEGIGIFGFAVLAIFWIGFSVFVQKKFGFFVLVFITVCGFIVFQHVVLGFREKYKRVFGFDIRCGFQFFLSKLFGFRFLFDLSGNYTPPMISNSR